MKSFVTFGLVAGAYASSCCTFELTASGSQSGTVGQLSDGQIRIGGGLPQSSFTICNGSITDSNGYGCLLTPEVEQFQCDLNKSPASGFSIAGNGTFEYSGSSVFYACPASDTEWNIYTTPVAGQAKCVEISLEASGCGAETCSSAVASTVTETVTSISTVVQASTVIQSVTVTVSECGGSKTPIVVTTTPINSYSISTPIETTSVIVTLPTKSVSYTPTQSPTYTPSSSVIVATPPTSTLTTYSATSTPVESTTCSESLTTIASTSIYTPTSIPLSTGPTTLYTSTSTKSHHWSNTTSYAPTSTTSSAPSCVSTALTGTYTAGNYQYPHLIVPVSSTSPNTAYGTQYFGTISSNVSTIFNFDIPTSYSGHTCNLIFLLPLQSQLETSSYEFSGTGGVEFEQLSSAATTSTTYNNAPSVSADLGDFTLTEGSSTLISSFECQAGQTVAYEAKAVGDTYLYFFQDYNPSPLGLYITVC